MLERLFALIAGALRAVFGRQRHAPGSDRPSARPSPQPAAREAGVAASEQPSVSVAPETRREFASRADRFEGLYEPLHWACVEAPNADRCRGVLGEWETRLKYGGGEALDRAWRELVAGTTGSPDLGAGESAGDEEVISLGERWLELLYAWGAERDGRSTLVLDEDEKRRYRTDEASEADQRFEIERPCWTYEGEVIERGIAKAVEDSP